MPGASESLPAPEQRLAERLLRFELLDGAWPIRGASCACTAMSGLRRVNIDGIRTPTYRSWRSCRGLAGASAVSGKRCRHHDQPHSGRIYRLVETDPVTRYVVSG